MKDIDAKKTIVSVTLSSEDIDWLGETAKREDRSVSATVRQMIKYCRDNGVKI